jgi:argininosuccinate lyase
MSQKAWGGRFEGGTDASVELFTESISIDRRLWREDLAASIAHARMLGQVGLVSETEAAALVAGLEGIRGELEAGSFPFRVELEDIHMHVEAALIERLGDVGRKLHTGRSRNDQVQTDFRLWIRAALDRVTARIVTLQGALVDAAKRHQELVMPAYTHWQRAQPVLAAHYLLAYAERLDRDRERLVDCRRRVNRLPLGSAALAGTSLPIDRDLVARELGFDGVTANSLDTSGDRDFAVESCFTLSLIASHLAGWADEWIVFNTTEFGFLKLPDALCTGSSIMPQKKNPDVLELIRGKSASVMSSLTQLQLLTYKLPVAYSRDLQEDKKVIFEAFDTSESMLAMMELMVRGMRLDDGAIRARLAAGFMDATALMELLIKHGMPMRQAHEVVGHAVGFCEKKGLELAAIAPADWARLGVPAGVDPAAVLGVERAVRALASYGSSGPDQVKTQLAKWDARLRD